MEKFSESFFGGIWYVINWPNYQFLLLLVAISIAATFKDWIKLLLIAALSSVGFATGFALKQANWFDVKDDFLGFGVAALLILFAIYNFTSKGKNLNSNLRVYFSTLFGFLMGFSFKIPLLEKLFGGNVWANLPGFVLGIAAAQVLSMLLILVLTLLVAEAFGVAKRDWTLGLSGAVLGIASIKLLESIF